MSYRGYPRSHGDHGSSYGARNYGYRSSGRSSSRTRSHNTSNSSHGSSSQNRAPDYSLHNGMVRSNSKRSSKRSSKRKMQRPHGHTNSFETASSVSSNNSMSTGKTSSTVTGPVTTSSSGVAYTPYSQTSSSNTTTPPQKRSIFNFTGRGIGATIAIFAGIVMGGTGLMMLVLGFTAGTAMLVMGPCLMVAGLVAIAVGAGVCICCKKKSADDDDNEGATGDKDNTIDSDVESGSKPSGVLGGGSGNFNMAYSADGAEDSIDQEIPSITAQVPQNGMMRQPYPNPYQPYNQQYNQQQNQQYNQQYSQQYNQQQNQPISFSEAQAAVVLTPPKQVSTPVSSPVNSFQPIQAAPVNARPPLVFEPARSEPQPQNQPQAPQPNNTVKPRPKLLPLGNSPPEEAPPAKAPIKLPVPVRAPVINFNPMPAPKSKGKKGSKSSPLGTPQSSFSDNSELSTSSADESHSQNTNTSLETDTSTTGEGGERKRQKVKKRVSFSDDKESKKKRKSQMRQSMEDSGNSANESLDGRPKGILSNPGGQEDKKYVGPPEKVREHTQRNRGRSSSRDRNSSVRNSHRKSRSRSPKHVPPNKQYRNNQPHPPSNQQQQQQAPTLQMNRPKPPVDENDPAVQSRQRRNSRRKLQKQANAVGSPPVSSGDETLNPGDIQFSMMPAGAPGGGFVNPAMEMDSPTHNTSVPMATSSPTPMHMNNNQGEGKWLPIQPAGRSTPPTLNTSLQLAGVHTNSSTETEI